MACSCVPEISVLDACGMARPIVLFVAKTAHEQVLTRCDSVIRQGNEVRDEITCS